MNATSSHRFGGPWTQRKLSALRAYLTQYQVIFTRNPAARSLETIYVDAFAGTGDHTPGSAERDDSLFGYGEETQEFQQGSARVALELESKFSRYVFIDRKARHIETLRATVERELTPMLPRCEFVHGDANEWLMRWCTTQDWRRQRAVVFLDPYGMSVEWRTIEAIAKTQAIDLWILFPFAIGANRMTPSDTLPDKDWAMILTKVFGTVEWTKRFYRRSETTDLFGEQTNSVTKIAGADDILEYFIERLRTIFPHVVGQPMILRNSNNSPMYALCFAAGNPKGGAIALKIASYLARTR